MRRSAVFLFVTVLLVVAGCGGSGSGSGGSADPARVMPASAVFYVEGTVRPDGDQQDNLRALLGKVLRTDDPSAELEKLFDDAIAKDSGGVTYEKDIAPWLGKRFGATATNLAADHPGFVVAIATTDADRAAEFVAGQARHDKASKRSAGDIDFWVDPKDDTVSGVIGDYVVLTSTEADFKRAIQTEQGDGLASVKRFSDSMDQLEDDRIGAFWVDPKAFGDLAAAQAGDASAKRIIDAAIGSAKPITAALIAEEDAATIESRTEIPENGRKVLGAFGSGSPSELLKSLPGDAWAALGTPDAGKALQSELTSVAGGIGSAVLGGQLRQATGLDLSRDILSWIGDVAVFVRGNSPADIRGAIVISATDEDKAAAALPRLLGAIQQQGAARVSPVALKGADQAFSLEAAGTPGPVIVARAGDRVVVAIGESTAQEALTPSQTLGDSGLYERAKGAIDGLDPSVFVDAPAAVRLIEAGAAGDPDLAKARPYLEMLDVLAAGSKREGDSVRSRFTVKVR